MKKCEFIWNIGECIFDSSIKFCLWLSKDVLKRYFGIETALYNIWWAEHCEYMQRKLDKEHSKYAPV